MRLVACSSTHRDCPDSPPPPPCASLWLCPPLSALPPLPQVVLAALGIVICYADRSNMSTAILPMSAALGWDKVRRGRRGRGGGSWGGWVVWGEGRAGSWWGPRVQLGLLMYTW